jgi:hypothetical protein
MKKKSSIMGNNRFRPLEITDIVTTKAHEMWVPIREGSLSRDWDLVQNSPNVIQCV